MLLLQPSPIFSFFKNVSTDTQSHPQEYVSSTISRSVVQSRWFSLLPIHSFLVLSFLSVFKIFFSGFAVNAILILNIVTINYTLYYQTNTLYISIVYYYAILFIITITGIFYFWGVKGFCRGVVPFYNSDGGLLWHPRLVSMHPALCD